MGDLQPLTNERIMHFWDTRVGMPTERYPLTNDDVLQFARTIAEEAVRQEREAVKPLIDAAEKALHEMCHTASPRESFTDAVDALDAAIAAIRARSEQGGEG